jgi:hypothetical protein
MTKLWALSGMGTGSRLIPNHTQIARHAYVVTDRVMRQSLGTRRLHVELRKSGLASPVFDPVDADARGVAPSKLPTR